MPTLQSTYAATHTQSVEGMVANSEPCIVVSRIAEDAEGIGFGKVCVMGDADNTVTDSEASKKFEGISVMDPTQNGATADMFPQYATVPVMKQGVIWVTASVAVAKGDPVYFVPATGVLTNVSTSNTLIANATWDSATAGAALAKLRLA
jgi:hypothetical protein